ncbi:MAG: hypothetical protein QY304_01860 [Candidatus Paceibacterota bacterium]|nr:MAG: hypothetical protein QY304_01860 [Candidatus Paceibacterota bacterium]
MNPQEKELLEKTLEYTRENNKMLRAMRRSIRFSSFLRVAYWLIIIGLGIGLYKYLQPFLEEFKDIFNQVVELKNSFGNSG